MFARLVRPKGEPLSPEALLARGKDAFDAAHDVKSTPYGNRVDEGRRLNVRQALKDAVRRAAYRELVAAARSGDIIAVGNKGHQADHTTLWREANRPTEEFPNGAIRDMFGADARDLNLIKIIHDLGKLPESEQTAHLRAYIKDRVKGDFLKTRILGHGFDSIARIAELVQREGDRLDIPKEEQLDAFLQLADAVAWHNFGPVADRAEAAKRYPNLTEAELDTLANAFWPTFFNKGLSGPDGRTVVSAFKDDLEIEVYGDSSDRGVLQKLLALDDRAALVTAKAPDKIGNQNLKVNDPTALTFNRDLITATFIKPAAETVVAVKAMAEELRPFVVNPRYRVEDYPTYRKAMELTGKLKSTGEAIREMNGDANLRALGVDADAARHTLVYRANNGNWYRIDGRDKAKPVVSVQIGESWHVVEGKFNGTAFDALMTLVREDGRWQ